MKKIVILGSTGNLGLQVVDIVRKNRDRFKIEAVSCNTNIDIAERQIKEFDIPVAAVVDDVKALELSRRVDCDVYSGISGVVGLTTIDSVHQVVNTLVGSTGIRPTISAIINNKDVALANKETLVTAGDYIMSLAKKYSVNIFPVDSEHSAIYQCLHHERREHISRLIITCSGGPFRDKEYEELFEMRAEDAIKHPSWNMGAKISVDSATLMNKGFEVIEANVLFDVDYSKIDVVIHPQSIIHSLVAFTDSSVLAQLSYPDMRLPIQYALTYPERQACDLEPINLAHISSLNFSAPKIDLFPCLEYAYEAGKIGGTMPCVLNAVNEVAVQAFLHGKIGFMDIPRLIREELDRHSYSLNPDIEEILELDEEIKAATASKLNLEWEKDRATAAAR